MESLSSGMNIEFLLKVQYVTTVHTMSICAVMQQMCAVL